jgi:hypothetical protein
MPSPSPSDLPSDLPSNEPSQQPSFHPSDLPSLRPSNNPSDPPVELWTNITFDDFESGLGTFSSGGSDAKHETKQTKNIKNGTGAALIRDDSSTSVIRQPAEGQDPFDVSGFSELRVSFWFITRSFSGSQSFHLEYTSNGGDSWIMVKTWRFGIDPFQQNGVFYYETVVFDAPNSNEFGIGFRCDAGSNKDKVYLDDVRLEGKV